MIKLNIVMYVNSWFMTRSFSAFNFNISSRVISRTSKYDNSSFVNFFLFFTAFNWEDDDDDDDSTQRALALDEIKVPVGACRGIVAVVAVKAETVIVDMVIAQNSNWINRSMVICDRSPFESSPVLRT